MDRVQRVAALSFVGLWVWAGCGSDEKRGLSFDGGSGTGAFDVFPFTPDARPDGESPLDTGQPDAPGVDAEVVFDAASEPDVAPTPVCGNGKLEAGEICDDGNDDNTDACVQGCQNARCGDGYVRAGVESCDDGNQVNTDACTNECATPSCGDGIVQPGEACDDGNRVNTDDCSNACQGRRCGDNIVQSGEGCDDGNAVNNDACSNACQPARCGDNITQAPETCDDGNAVNDDACSNACQRARCGDNIVQAGEQCDDGNTVNNDDCSNACQRPRCGDNIVQAGEDCDDANTSNADACLNTCKFSKCVPLPNVDDNNPCTTDTCDPLTGPRHTPVAVGTLCPDTNVCDGINKCNADGQCAATPAPPVPPSTACRKHSCDPARGNVFEDALRGATCEDGNICNGQETCDGAGQCVAGAPAAARTVCDDGNVCNGIARCNGQGACEVPSVYPARGASCSEGQTCLVCNGQGVCETPTPQNLDDGNGCTVDSCDLQKGAVSVPDARLNTSCSYVCGRNCTIGIAGPICFPTFCTGFYTCQNNAVVCQAPIIL